MAPGNKTGITHLFDAAATPAVINAISESERDAGTNTMTPSDSLRPPNISSVRDGPIATAL